MGAPGCVGQDALRCRSGTFGGSLLFRYAVQDSLGLKVPFLQFFPAVMLAAWFGGLGPGILVTALSTVASMYFLLPPSGMAVSDSADQLSLGIFVVTDVVISWLNHQLHQAQNEQRGTLAIGSARTAELEAVLDTTLDGIIVINAKGTINAFNRGAQEMFGYPASEVIGRNLSLPMPSPHHEDHDKYLERYLTTGDAKIIGIGRQVMGRRRNGTAFPLHLAVGEMQINGERKFTGMLHDLTKRVDLANQLQASEGRSRTIIETATDGIIVIDAHGRIETFNPAAERLFGYATAEVLGRNVDMLMPSPHHEEHDTYLSR